MHSPVVALIAKWRAHEAHWSHEWYVQDAIEKAYTECADQLEAALKAETASYRGEFEAERAKESK